MRITYYIILLLLVPLCLLAQNETVIGYQDVLAKNISVDVISGGKTFEVPVKKMTRIPLFSAVGSIEIIPKDGKSESIFRPFNITTKDEILKVILIDFLALRKEARDAKRQFTADSLRQINYARQERARLSSLDQQRRARVSHENQIYSPLAGLNCIGLEDCGEFSSSASAGAFFRTHTRSGLIIQPEIYYAQRGTEGNLVFTSSQSLTGDTYAYKLTYIKANFLIGKLFINDFSSRGFSILYGPYLGVAGDGEYSRISSMGSMYGKRNLDVKTDIGFTIRASVEWHLNNFFIQAGGELFFSFTNIDDNLDFLGDDPSKGGNSGIALSFGTGYKF